MQHQLPCWLPAVWLQLQLVGMCQLHSWHKHCGHSKPTKRRLKGKGLHHHPHQLRVCCRRTCPWACSIWTYWWGKLYTLRSSFLLGRPAQ